MVIKHHKIWIIGTFFVMYYTNETELIYIWFLDFNCYTFSIHPKAFLQQQGGSCLLSLHCLIYVLNFFIVVL